MTLMFWNYIQNVVNVVKEANPNINGEFYIGMEPIVDFVFFYCITNERQEKQKKNYKNILEYSKENFILDEKERKNLTEEMQDALFKSAYEKKLYYFNTLNSKSMLNKIKRTELEKKIRAIKQQKGQNLDGNAQRFKGLEIFSFQEDELTTLVSIKQGDYDDKKANMTYKRLVSEKGYLHHLKFKEYTNFVDILRKEIKEMPMGNKNVQLYKLEKTLNYELLKCTAVALNQSKQTSTFDEESVIRDLLLVFGLPFLEARQQYTMIYPQLNKADRDNWRREVQGLTCFTMDCITVLVKTLQGVYEPMLTKEDLKRLNNLYLSESFKNDYIQRKDFNAEDFKSILNVLDSMNSIAFEEEIQKIKKT